MQTKGVKANDVTPMEKLVGWGKRRDELCICQSTGQGEALCGGCTAIALYSTRRIRHLVLVVALKAVYVEEHL